MLVSFQCKDSKDSQTLRLTHLKAHLQWVEENMVCIKVAGPIKASIKDSTIGEDGSCGSENGSPDYIGSMYIIEADSLEQAQALLATDPYHQAQIWQSITCNEFSAFAGTWVGGKNWPGAT